MTYPASITSKSYMPYPHPASHPYAHAPAQRKDQKAELNDYEPQHKKDYAHMPHLNQQGDQVPPRAVPFETAQDAWFWFIDAQQAKDDGARITAGQGLVPRPCEPLDIFHVVDRLYRNRRLIWDHMLVLRHYGLRKMAPDPYRPKEAKAATLWGEAMERLEEAFIRKCIVAPRRDTPFHDLKKYHHGSNAQKQEKGYHS